MLLYIFFIIFIIASDQVTKYLAVLKLKNSGSFNIIEDVFRFTYHENKGAAWGMLANSRWVFMVISTVAIIVFAVYLYKLRNSKDILLKLSISMFIGGGIGNMIDRVFSGFVVDFIDFCLIDFPIFNVADSFVTVGAFLMILYVILDTVKNRNGNKNV